MLVQNVRYCFGGCRAMRHVKAFNRQTSTSNTANGARYSRVSIRNITDAERLSQVLPTYLRHPASASSLRELSYEQPYDFDRRDPSQPMIQTNTMSSDQRMVAEHIGSAKLGSRFTKEEYESCLRSGDHPFADATITAALMLAPNLTILRLEELDSDSHVYKFLHSNNYNELPNRYLQHLQRIELKPDSTSVYADERFFVRFFLFRQLALFHHLPKLESLAVETMTEDINDDSIIPPHISNLKRISVSHSNLGSHTLGGLIRLPRKGFLQEFRFTFGGRCEMGPGDPMLSLDVVGKALRTQKSSLQILELDFGDQVGWNYHYSPGQGSADNKYFAEILAELRKDPYFVKDEIQSGHTVWPWDAEGGLESESEPHTIGSLAGFEKLRLLRISIAALLRPREEGAVRLALGDILPSNLEELTLIDYIPHEYPDLDKEVEEFMRIKGEKFPSLRKTEGVGEPVLGECSKFTHTDSEDDVLWPEPNWGAEWVEVKDY